MRLSMDKIIIGIAIIIIAIIGSVSAYIVVRDQSNISTVPSGASVIPVVDACDILTQNIAQRTLGANDLMHPDSKKTSTTTSDIATSSCTYATKTTISDTGTTTKGSGVNLIVRSAKTQTGIDANLQLFASLIQDYKPLKNIGDKAVYSTNSPEIYVIKSGNLYLITGYADIYTNNSLAVETAVASKLQFK